MKVGLIAGGGGLPLYVRQALIETQTPHCIIAISPFADPNDYASSSTATLGQFGHLVKSFKAEDCTHLCFAGVINRPDFGRFKPDFKGWRHLPGTIKAARDGDDALMRHVLGLFENEGFQIIPPQELCESLLMPAGALGAHGLRKLHRDDALRACEIAREIGRLDIGQGVVVVDGVTLCVEAQEGTDAMLARLIDLPVQLCGTPAARKGVLAKMMKPTQDARVDLPTIGPETIARVAQAGLAGVVLEERRAFIIDRADVVAAADAAGIFVVGIPAADPISSPA